MSGFTYKSYSFIDKDPIIDEIRTKIQESGATYKWISEGSSVSTQTIRKWLDGETKKPQAATINAVLRAIGYKLEIVRFGELVRLVPESKPLSTKHDVRHVVQINKYKKTKRSHRG
jgi:predicted transcriptional regulator